MGTLKKIEKVKNENGVQPKAQGGRLVRVGTRSAPSFLGTEPVKAERQAAESEGFAGGRESGPRTKYSLGKNLAGAAQKGLNLIARGGGDLLAMAEDAALAPFELFAGQELGTASDSGLFNQWADKIRGEGDALEDHYADNIEAGGLGAKIIDTVGAGTVAALPNAIAAFLTGGATAAAHTADGLAQAAKTAMSPGLVSTIRSAVKAMARDPQYWLSFAQTVGTTYEDSVREMEAQAAAAKAFGAEPKYDNNAIRARAALNALGNGLMGAAVEVGGGIQTLPEAMRHGKGTWKTLVDTMLDEGREEVVQGWIERAMQNLTYDRGNALASLTDPEAVFSLPAAGQEFAGGAVVGGILGGGQIAVNKALGRLQAQGDTGIPTETETPATGRDTANGGAEEIGNSQRGDNTLVKQIRQFLPEISGMDAVADIKGNELPEGNKLVDRLVSFVNAIGNKVNRPGFGDVLFSKGRIKSSMIGHGTGPIKIETFAAVPAVIQSGVQIDYQKNWKGRSYDTYTFAAPVNYKGEKTYLGVIVTKDSKDGRYYVHEVVDENGGLIYQSKEAPTTASDGTSALPGDLDTVAAAKASEISVPQEAGAVNGETVGRAAEPGYHGGATAGIMTVYEATMLDRLGKAAGVAIQAAPPTGDGRQGWYQNGRVYIAEDAQDPVLTVARHEITHRLQETAPEQYRAFRDYAAGVLERRGGVQEQIDAITRLYAAHGQELTEEEALDELAADFAGELLTDEAAIRRLAGENRTLGQRIRDAIHDLLRRVRAALGGEEKRTLERAARLWDQALGASRGAERAGDGGTRYSINYDAGNRPFVAVEEDILDGVPESQWVKTVKDTLRKKFPNGVTVGNNTIKIDGQTRREMTWGRYNQWLRSADPAAYADKLRAASNADEILLASRDYINEGLNHPRKDKITDFARGTVQLQIGAHDYVADVIVGGRSDGSMVLYDLLNLKPTQIIEKSQARQTENPLPGAGRNTATDFMDSIPQDSTKGKGELLDNPRYSVKGARDLEKQVELLQRQNARLKEQMKRTGVPRADHQAVSRQARELLSQYSSEYDKGRLTTRLEGLYEDMAARGGSIWEQDHAPSWEELRQSARKLAEDILAESWENVNSLTAEYRDFQRELRGRAITLSPQYRSDMESVGGYENFRKRYFGRLRLANQGTPVDVLYQELAVRWPELLPDDIVHPADQLVRMADMLDQLAPVMGNAYEADMDRTAEYLAGEILERFYDTPQEAPTFADRAARQREQQRLKDREAFQERMTEKLADQSERHEQQTEKLRERYDKRLEQKDQKVKRLEAEKKADREAFREKYRNQRERRERDIKALKEKYRQQNRERTEKQTDAQWRETIRRGAARLSRKLTKPTNNSHIPEKLRGTVLNLLRSIDTSSRFEYVFGPDAKYHRVAAGSALGAEPATRTEAARALQASYEKLASEGGITVDPDMKNYLDLLSDMGNISLDEMSHDQLDTVRKVLRVIEHTVSKTDELLQESKFQTVSDMARALREENGGRRDRRNYAGPWGAADKLMNLDMLTPETFLHRLGTAGEDLYRQMRLADDKKTAILKEATDRGRELVKESGVDFAKADKELHTFDLEDGELTLSTSQIMELYALSHREQALEHIYIGGLLSRGNTGRFGVKLEKPRAVKVSPMDVANILSTLTPEQKALMDGLQSYLSGDLARHGNQASLQVYGYEKFKERSYWPIRVSQEQVGSNPAQKAAAKTIPGFGMTKALTEHASNAVELRSAADTFSDHVTQMATYAAWLGTSENVTRLMNHTYAADGGGWKPGEGRSRDGTVRELLRQVYGEGGVEYLEKLLGDVANGTKAVRDANFSMGGMTSAFKASAVGGNLRVILQQPTAILRAAEMMDPKYLMMGMARRGGWKKALAHSPIAQWKDWGYFEIGTGRSVREIMLGAEGALNKARSAMMAPAGQMDAVAWGALWNAVEAETRAEHKELGESTQAFYDHCNRRFGEIIDRTQVVDTVLHRSQAMRSQSELYKMATSFMSEPTKIYNEIARGVYDYTQAENREDRIKAVKGLGRKAFALSLSFAVNAIAQSLPDAWRDKDREKSFWGRFGENWVENFLENYNLVGYVPFLKDGLSVVRGFDVGRMDMELFSDIVSSAIQVQKAAEGKGKVTLGYASLELALQACRALGLPLANIKRDIVGIASNGLLDLGLYEQAYELDKLMYREEEDQGRFVADLYRAMNGDDEDYRAIYRDLEATMEELYPGEGGKKLKAAMENRMKKELGVRHNDSLPVRYSAPGADPAFDRLIRAGQSAGGWISALPEGAAELAGSLDAMEDPKTIDRLLAIGDSPWSEAVKEDAMEVNLTGKGLERYRAARRSGVSTYAYTDFLDRAYRAARKRTGKDSASPSQADVEKALESASLTDRQRTAIWNGYGWKKESPWG